MGKSLPNKSCVFFEMHLQKSYKEIDESSLFTMINSDTKPKIESRGCFYAYLGKVLEFFNHGQASELWYFVHKTFGKYSI